MLSWVIPLKAFNQISEVIVACKYYSIIAEFTTLNDVWHLLYVASSYEQFQVAGVFYQMCK